MDFIPFFEISPEEWDQVVYLSKDGWAFSTSAWLDMVTPVWQLQNVSFAIRESGHLVAALPLHYNPAAQRLSSSGWGFGGPVVVNGVSPADRSRLWKACLGQMRALAENCRARELTIMLPPLNRTSLENRWGVNPLAEFGWTDVSTHTRIVDLTQTEEALWYGLAKDARQRIKRARTAGYSVRVCPWSEMAEPYYRVHVETYERTGVKPHPKAYFDGIAAVQGGHALLRVGFAPDGRPVAFHNDARFDVTALYHTGCSESTHLESGINYWLFWEALVGAKADGCAWYETGEAFPQVKSGKDKGLTDFKGKFGGEFHRYFKGEIRLEIEPPKAAMIQVADRAEPARRLVGRRLAAWNWLRATRDLVAVLVGTRTAQLPQQIVLRLLDVVRRLRPPTGKAQGAELRSSRTPETIAERARALYSQDGVYRADTISHLPAAGLTSYSDVLLKIRLDLVRQFASEAMVLDVCCATGQHLFSFAEIVKFGIGIDFSEPYIGRAMAARSANAIANADFLCSDARRLPFSDNHFDVAYSFSALYQIPMVEAVIREMGRVVKPGGKCILDLGNLYSLNTFVSDAHPELPERCYIPVSAMKRGIRQAGLVIVTHRSFQILPLWSDRPCWLKLFLWPGWTKVMSRTVGGKMLDEWISSLPVLKLLAFRHVFVCEKR